MNYLYEIPVLVVRRASVIVKAKTLADAIKEVEDDNSPKVCKIGVSNQSVKIDYPMVEIYNPGRE